MRVGTKSGVDGGESRISDNALSGSVDATGLLDDLTVVGGRDWIRGGDGDDAAVGDSLVVLAGLVSGLPDGFALLGGLQTTTPAHDAHIEVNATKLVDYLKVRGDRDLIVGGKGSDGMVGDSIVAVTGVWSAQFWDKGLTQGSNSDAEALDGRVKATRLVDDVKVHGKTDWMWGGPGDGRMFGDNIVKVWPVAVGIGMAAPCPWSGSTVTWLQSGR